MHKHLLERYYAGTCTDEERKAVESWLAEHDELPEPGISENALQQAAAWEMLRERTVLRRTSFSPTRIAVAAALLLAVATGAFFLLRSTPSLQINWQTVHNPGGRAMKVSLPDGSWVQLNGGAALEYPSAFEDGKRTVRLLSGEAFFNIHQQQQPFVVQAAGESAVQVLGTRFNIRHLPSSMLAITLTSGKIRFEAPGSLSRVLAPGEQLLYAVNERSIKEVRPVDTLAVAGWQEGLLLFRDTDIKEVLDVIARYYGVHFVHEELGQQQLSARFTARPLDEVLRLVGNAADLHFQRKGDTVYIRP